MSAGLRRLLTAWSAFGILLAVDVVTTVTNRHSSPTHSLLDCGGLGAFTWCMFESFLGPWAKDRESRPDAGKAERDAEQARLEAEKAARVMADAVGEHLRAENDRDGQRERRCS
jgi:hypothetical protein